MTAARDNALMALLNCGDWDLQLIDDVHYDWRDILSFRDGWDWPASINTLMQYVVDYGVAQLQTAISDRICELEAIPNERELDDEEEEELRSLRVLNPDDDIDCFFNCVLDTHIWFANHGDVYREYLPDALEAFADGTGLEIE